MKLPPTLEECHDLLAVLQAEKAELRHEISELQDKLDEVKLDRDFQEGEILDLRQALDAAYRADDSRDDSGNKHGETYYDPAED
jgi:predicted nuclease with TOPRIM domain